MSDLRYGLYLRPSYAMCRAQVELHDLLQRQYSLVAAGKFMPHATIKGFFRTAATPDTLIAAVDAALTGWQAFQVYNNGVVAYAQDAIVLRIHHTPDGKPNELLLDLHQRIGSALMPLVDAQCAFTSNERKRRFEAHLTLAMADIPTAFFAEILHFVQAAEPVGPAHFLADTLHLYAFTSADWVGRWWDTLRWQLLHSWTAQQTLSGIRPGAVLA